MAAPEVPAPPEISGLVLMWGGSLLEDRLFPLPAPISSALTLRER